MNGGRLLSVAAARADRFLFAPVDRRVARTFRALLALVLVGAFWPGSHVPLGFIARQPDAAALWGSVFLSSGWWIACLLALAAFAVGLGGRAAGLGAALLLLPLVFVHAAQSRQVLWLALLAFSLLRAGPPCTRSGSGTRGEPPAGPIWPVRLLQLQLSTVYAVNAWAKLTPQYLSGDVLIALSRGMPNFLVDLSDGHLHLGALAVPVWLCAVGTVVVESALALGFWIPKLRMATAALGVGFHLSLRWVLTIGWLDWTCLLLYLAFLLPFQADPTRRELVRPMPAARAGRLPGEARSDTFP